MIEENVERAIQSLKAAEKSHYIGEEVSQLEHALQSAYFAEKSGHSEDVILGSLFHDIGHFASNTAQSTMNHLGVVNHEWIGAKLIYDMGFSKKVALLIGYHVDAKRYLARKKSHYYEKLSEASRGTLIFQGGPMNEHEMQKFEMHPYFKEILQTRINDEKGKELGINFPGIEYYRPRIMNHISRNQTNHIFKKTCELKNFVDTKWVSTLKEFLEEV